MATTVAQSPNPVEFVQQHSDLTENWPFNANHAPLLRARWLDFNRLAFRERMQRGDAAPAYAGSSGVDDLFTDLRSGEFRR